MQILSVVSIEVICKPIIRIASDAIVVKFWSNLQTNHTHCLWCHSCQVLPGVYYDSQYQRLCIDPKISKEFFSLMSKAFAIASPRCIAAWFVEYIFLNPNCKGDKILFALKNEYSLEWIIFSRIWEDWQQTNWSKMVCCCRTIYFWDWDFFCFLKWDGKILVLKELLNMGVKTVSSRVHCLVLIWQHMKEYCPPNWILRQNSLWFSLSPKDWLGIKTRMT